METKNVANVMIADDQTIMQNLIKFLTESMGHRITAIASSGEEAISTFPEVKPDIVTLDINLGDMSGIDVMVKLKEMDPEVKIIIISGFQEEIPEEDIIDKGASGILRKPFNMNDYKKVITGLTAC